MTVKDKTTRKREYAFQVLNGGRQLVIVDEAEKVLRTYDAATLPASIVTYACGHGLKQKLTDDTMVSKLSEGESRLDACDALWARLRTADGTGWDKEREGIARPPEALIVFVMEKKSITREVATASLKQAGKEKWDAIAKAHAKDVAAIQERIAAAKKQAEAIDLSTL